MGGRAFQVLSLAALAAVLAGCGGGKSSAPAPPTTATTPPPAATAPPAPTLTSPVDLAACNQLEGNIRIVSQIVSSSVEAMTQSLHPKQLAKRTGEAEKNLRLSASVLARIQAPSSLARSQRQLVAGLRSFAADFGRAQRSIVRSDMEKAARQLVDRLALAKVTAATAKIDRACGA